MGSREREREIAEGLKTKIKASVGGGERVRGEKKGRKRRRGSNGGSSRRKVL